MGMTNPNIGVTLSSFKMQRGFFPRVLIKLNKFIESKTGTYRLRSRTDRRLSQQRTAL